MKLSTNSPKLFGAHAAKRLFTLQVVAALLWASAAKAELDPQDAFNRADEAGPADATEIDLSDFEKLLQSGELVIDSPSKATLLRQDAAKTEAADRALVESVLANDPERLKRISVDNDRPIAGGINGLYDIPDLDRQTTLLGERYIYGEIAAGIRNFPTRENQLAIYEILWRELKPDTSYPSPRAMAQESPETILAWNKSLTKFAVTRVPRDPAPWRRPSCNEEKGLTPGVPATDAAGSFCSEEPQGLAKSAIYPLKESRTCARDQAMRGSCVAFAIIAALETHRADRTAEYWNLSEQEFYGRAKSVWTPENFYDGLFADASARHSRDDLHLLAGEGAWPYNPSFSRVDAGWWTWQNSCVGYGDPRCSDTAHQTRRVCAVDLRGNTRHCGFRPEVSPGTDFRIRRVAGLWDSWNARESVTRIRTMVRAATPVVLCLPVTRGFDFAVSSRGGRGYLNYFGHDGGSRGGHCITVVGHVAEGDIPPDAPAASGGYFIAKNSWSNCAGDAGYVYLPEQWVHDFAHSATVVDESR